MKRKRQKRAGGGNPWEKIKAQLAAKDARIAELERVLHGSDAKLANYDSLQDHAIRLENENVDLKEQLQREQQRTVANASTVARSNDWEAGMQREIERLRDIITRVAHSGFQIEASRRVM